MQARKSNKVYTITEEQASFYQKSGFDIYDGDRLVSHGVGKTVSIEEYEKALARIAQLEKQLKNKGNGRPTKADMMKDAKRMGIEVPAGLTNPELYELVYGSK